MESFSKNIVVARVFAQKRAVIAATIASFVASGASLGIPWLVARVVRSATGDGDVELAAIGAAFAVLLVARTISLVVSNYALAAAEFDVGASLKHDVFAVIQRMGLGYHDQRAEGDKVAVITMDVDAVASFGVQAPVALLNALVTFIGAVILMGTISWQLTAIVAILGPLIYVGARVVGARVNARSLEFWRQNGVVIQTVHESMHGLRVIKSFVREDERDALLTDELARLSEAGKSRAYAVAWLGPLVQLVMYAGLLAVVLVGLFASFGDALSLDQIAAFALYGLLLTAPLRAWADAYTGYQSARAAWERIEEDTRERPEDIGELDETAVFAGEVSFEAVTFRYPARPALLDQVSFTLNAGETVAIVGPNGGGKTTIAHLIAGLYPVTSGTVRFDGTPMTEYSLATVRHNVGLVPQHSPLFNTTIRENLRFGSPGADDRQLNAALERAEATEFVAALPEGLDTVIGDDGLRLSGGQRQRLALARAFLEDAPILILDEATSNFDPESEERFLRRNLPMWAGKTVIIITHRPSTLELVDRVIEIRDGQIG